MRTRTRRPRSGIALVATTALLTLFGGPNVTPHSDWDNMAPASAEVSDAPWSPVGLLDQQVLAVVGTESAVLAGTHYGGLLEIAGGPTAPVLRQPVATLSFGAGGLVAGTRAGGGVHYSSDGGATWTLLGDGPAANDVLAFVTHGNTLYAGTNRGVFALVGGTWEPRSAGLGGRVVTSLATLPGVLLAGTDHGVFRSTDAGTTWAAASSGPGQVTIRGLASVGTTLLAGSSRGLHRSVDNGASWTSIVGAAGAGVTSIATRDVPPWQLVFVGTSDGVLVSRDGGQTLTELGELPPPARRVHALGLVPVQCPQVVLGATDAGAYQASHDCGGPVAVDDAAHTPQYEPVRIRVLDNDSDPDRDALTIVAVGAATHGSVTDNGDGTITYSPSPRFKDSDSFTYRVSDGDDEATATVTVTEINCGEQGPVSRPVDREVEPLVAGVSEDTAKTLHDVNCDVIAGTAGL